MIGKLKGEVDTIGEEECLLDVKGVVYLVQCSAKTLHELRVGAQAVLHIETYVRQDIIRLFGFLHEEERAWFIRLQSIQGVGAKSALAILDRFSPEDLMQAAEMEEADWLVQTPGIGKKIAQRIVTELKGKAAPKMRLSVGLAKERKPLSASSFQSEKDQKDNSLYQMRQDAVSALVNLGFQENRVRSVMTSLQKENVSNIESAPVQSVDALIKAALKELAP